MAQIITKQDVEFSELRIQRRPSLDEQGQIVTETWVTVGYTVKTDDPPSDYKRTFEVGPLAGQNLTVADDIFARIYTALKNREEIS